MSEIEEKPSKSMMEISLILLLVVSLIFLGFISIKILGDATDTYLNQNSRLLAGSFTNIFLVSALIFNKKAQQAQGSRQFFNTLYKAMLGLCFAVLGISFWLLLEL